ncbi:cobalt ECF transporter T component CbiQ [Labilibaculum euxinus]
MEKFILFMVLLNCALLSGNLYMHLFLISLISIGFLTHGIDLIKLLRLIALPFGFIVLGSISIAFSLHADPENSLFCFDSMGLCIGLETAGLHKALDLFFKAMAAVMALNYLILSCSLSELNDIGRKLKIPLILRELFVLTYRYISLLFTFTGQVHIAQRNRLGYARRKQSISSVGMLFSSVFIKSLLFSDRSLEALQSRGYNGEFYFRQQKEVLRLKQVLSMLVFGILLLFLDNYSNLFDLISHI